MAEKIKKACIIISVLLSIILAGALCWGLMNYVDNISEQLIEIIEDRQDAQEAYYSGIEDCISDGYTVYLDGVKINPNTIDIRLYSVSIDYEKQAVFLTYK